VATISYENADAAYVAIAVKNYRSDAACGCGPSFPPAFFGTATRTHKVSSVTIAASERIFVKKVGVMAALPISCRSRTNAS
jgi:hypothetical protein